MIEQQTLATYSAPVAQKSVYDHLNGGYFAAVRLDDFSPENLAAAATYSRKDFYKISLIRGDADYHYRDKAYQVRPGEQVVVFTNRQTPYRWEIHSGACSGYSCMFTDDFLPLHTHKRPHDMAVFSEPGYAMLHVDQQQADAFEQLFGKMLEEQGSEYPHKYELLFLYVMECIHLGLKLVPDRTDSGQTAATRLTTAFNLLLNQQFPLVNPFQKLPLKSPEAFADKLAVHVNYLNRVLKHQTGKTTTQLITERIMQEARSLLLHSNWSVSQISESLGFDEPTHFTKAFKKITGHLPSALRRMV